MLRAAVMQLPTSPERTAALKLLIEAHAEVGLQILCEASIRESDPQIRASQIRLIGLYQDISTLDRLMSFWDDPDENVRAATTDAIGWLHAPFPLPVPNQYNCRMRMFNIHPPIQLPLTTTKDGSGGNLVLAQHQTETTRANRTFDSLRPRVEQRMLYGKSSTEREAAARAIFNWQDKYTLRVAEWGVWISDNGQLKLMRSILDEIPPFVHTTGDHLSSLSDRVNEILFVTKPILHFTVDRPMSVCVKVMIQHGRPWFAFPMPDDFELTAETVDTHFTAVNVPALAQFDPVGLQSLTNPHIGYPWLDPGHACAGPTGSGPASHPENQITSLGLCWQSVIVSPARLEWMAPPSVPGGSTFQWWDRLRQVPCAWVSSRGESERFLYYDGPTSSQPPVVVTYDGRWLKFTESNTVPKDDRRLYRGTKDSFSSLDISKGCTTRKGVFIDVDSAGVSAAGVILDSTDNAYLPPFHHLQGQALVDAFHTLLTDAGLTPTEAAGLVDCWRPQFFQTPGSRFVLLMTAADYDLLCPIRIDPPPTELVRVGLVLTEFGNKN